MPPSERSPLLLAGPPATARSTSPRPFDAMTPHAPRALTGSPGTRTYAGGVPGRRHRPARHGTGTVGRLPLHLPPVLWTRALDKNAGDAR